MNKATDENVNNPHPYRVRIYLQLNFPPNFEGLVLGCIEAKVLQVLKNTRWKAVAEMYTMHSFAPFFNLKN